MSRLAKEDVVEYFALKKNYDNGPSGICVQDGEMNIIYANSAYRALFGEVEDKKCFEVMGKNRICEGCYIEKLLKGGKPVTELREKDGKYFDVTPSFLGEYQGKKYVKKTLTDVTEREKNRRMKDLFIDIVSHDLLNLTGIIKNYSELLVEGTESSKDEIKAIKKTAERMNELVNDVSKLSNMEHEKIEFKKMDLNTLFKETTKDLEGQAGEKNIIIEYKAKGSCPIEASPLIEDVYSNLLSNAIKYSPEGSRVEVDILNEGENYKFYVKDMGEGIDDKDKQLVFERFTRIHKGPIKGTGLGLAIAKSVVDLHSGKIWIEDRGDTKGSIFYVELPKKQKK